MTTPLDRVQFYQNKIMTYTNHGQDQINRHFEFLTSDTNDVIYFRVSAVTSIATGACLGAAAGSKLSNKNKIIGGISGSIAGSIAGTITYMTLAEQQKIYYDWIKMKIDDPIDAAIHQKYSDDPVLKNFMCPITYGFTTNPARTPTGYIVDLEHIMKCPRDASGNINDLITRGPSFPETALKPDLEAAFLVHKRIYGLVAMDINAAGENGPVKDALTRKLEKTRTEIKACYRKCLASIDRAFDNEEITFDKSQEKRQGFADCFGKMPQEQLNWELDWRGLLDQRWHAAIAKGKVKV